MSLSLQLGATLTGGTPTTLTSAGPMGPNKSSFVAPGSSRLAPRAVDFLITNPTPQKGDPGVARSGVRVAFANVVSEEGCCTRNSGTVIADINLRWPLSQPDSVVDDVIEYVRALVYTTEFEDAIKNGTLPT